VHVFSHNFLCLLTYLTPIGYFCSPVLLTPTKRRIFIVYILLCIITWKGGGCGTPASTVTLCGNRSEPVALRREQWEWLESKTAKS
jgi:hypothetical protein